MTKLDGDDLCIAIMDGDDAAVQAHLDAGGSPDLRSRGSPVVAAAAREKRLGIVRMLIKAGANLELVDNKYNNDTALTAGAREGALEVVEALLRAGADESHRGYEGRTAAQWAQKQGHKSVVALLANPPLPPAAALPEPEPARPETEGGVDATPEPKCCHPHTHRPRLKRSRKRRPRVSRPKKKRQRKRRPRVSRQNKKKRQRKRRPRVSRLKKKKRQRKRRPRVSRQKKKRQRKRRPRVSRLRKKKTTRMMKTLLRC